jgi:hypothetical protein
MAKEGHTLLFLGGEPVTEKSIFEETRHLSLPSGPRIVLDSRVKRKWLEEISSMKPDVIHAHNITVGHFLLDAEYPVIFDDDEVYSRQPYMYAGRTFIRRMAAKLLWNRFPKWEKQMAERFPIITVSEGLADYYRQFTSDVSVVPNTPSLKEVEWLTDKDERAGLVYIGNDFNWHSFLPFRDMTGLRDLIDFEIISGLPHDNMMERLTNYCIGLTPYRPHPFQLVCNANKNYEYQHAGLQVVVQYNFSAIFKGNPYVHPFKDYSEIKEVIDSVEPQDSQDIMNYARTHYVWEKNEHVIKDVYKRI